MALPSGSAWHAKATKPGQAPLRPVHLGGGGGLPTLRQSECPVRVLRCDLPRHHGSCHWDVLHFVLLLVIMPICTKKAGGMHARE